MFKNSLRLGLVTSALLLSACKLDLGVSRAMGNAFGEIMGRAMSCMVGAPFGLLAQAINIEMEAVEWNAIQRDITEQKVADVPQFWAKLNAEEAQRVRALVAASYDALAADDSYRQRPVTFYQDLMARTMIDMTRENLQVSSFRGIRMIKTGDRDVIYAVSVSLLHAGLPNSKSFATCE